MLTPPNPLPPGPDGFLDTPSNPLRQSHQLIDQILTEARAAGDPHLCRIESLETHAELAKLDGTGVIELVDAALGRVWRIEGLGPRALDEGGVRGWNSIGWLTNLLQTLFQLGIRPTGITAVSNLLSRLDARGPEVFASLGTGLPDLAEWIERTTPGLPLDAPTRKTLDELATRFESEPSPRSVWKERHLRRTATAFRNALAGWTPGAATVASVDPSVDPTAVPPAAARAHPPGIGGLWIDRRFQGERVLQHPLAERLRSAGWTFRLQGAWDPPLPPFTFAKERDARITLVLGERDPSDLLPGGSCRWVNLEEIRIAWEPPRHDLGEPVPMSTVPSDISELLHTAIRLVSASISRSDPTPETN